MSVGVMKWRCLDCQTWFYGPRDRKPDGGCPHCKSARVIDINAEPIYPASDAQPTEALDAMIGSANHTPGVADQMLLCEVMTKVLAAIDHMRAFSPERGHVGAAGHVRSALRYEREILEGMMDRNRHLGGAMRQLAGGS